MNKIRNFVCASALLLCGAVGGEAQVSHPPIRQGAADPATCNPGSGSSYSKLFFNTTTNTWKYCAAVNTWLSVGTSLGSGAVLAVGHPAESKTNSVATDQDYASVYTIPAGYLAENKCVRVFLGFQYVTGTSTAAVQNYLKLGATKVFTRPAALDIANGLTRSGLMTFVVCGTAPASGAANVETIYQPGGDWPGGTADLNNVVQPVALATNANLDVVPGVAWSATGSTETMVLRTFIVEEAGGGGSAAVTGNGANNRVAFWNAVSNLSSDLELTYDPTTNTLTVDNIAATGGTVNAGTLQQGGVQAVTISGTQTLTSKTLTTPVLGAFTVTGLPAAGTANRVAIVTDALTAGSCTSGGGSARAWCRDTGAAWEPLGDGGAGGGAPVGATYITQTADGTLTNEQALAALATGIMRVATTTGVVTSLTDSAGIAANLSDETGSGALVFSTNPTLLDVTVNDLLTFTETAGDPPCAAGDYGVKGNSTSGKLRGCENGTLFDVNTVAGAASWSSLSAPTAAVLMASDATTETATFSFESSFTTGVQFLVRQQTGLPTGGTLFGVTVNDADVLPFAVNDGISNTATVSRAGVVTGTSLVSSNSSGVAGHFECLEGTAPALVANSFQILCPADVAAGGLSFVLPGVAATGFVRAANSVGVMTLSVESETYQTFTRAEGCTAKVSASPGETFWDVINLGTAGIDRGFWVLDDDATNDAFLTCWGQMPVDVAGTPAAKIALEVSPQVACGASLNFRVNVKYLFYASGGQPNAAHTTETAQDIVGATTAFDQTAALFPATGSLASAPAASNFWVLEITRDSNHANDTCAQKMLISPESVRIVYDRVVKP